MNQVVVLLHPIRKHRIRASKTVGLKRSSLQAIDAMAGGRGTVEPWGSGHVMKSRCSLGSYLN